MNVLLAQIFIGWPAILGSLLVSCCGIAFKRQYLLAIGAALSLGFAFYLTRWQLYIFKIVGYSLPFLHLAGMYFVRYGLRRVAGLLLIPHIAVATCLGVMVLMQSR